MDILSPPGSLLACFTGGRQNVTMVKITTREMLKVAAASKQAVGSEK